MSFTLCGLYYLWYLGFTYFSIYFLLKDNCFINFAVFCQSSTWISHAAAKSLQSCLTLCDPIDESPPGSPAPGILQARTLEWVAISFSNAWKWKVKVKSLSHARLLATPWTAAHQATPSMGFSRQEYWSGLPLPSPDNMWTSHHIQMKELLSLCSLLLWLIGLKVF